MKVLHLVHAFTGGGIEKYILNLVDYMDRTDIELEVLGVGNHTLYDRVSELEKRNIPFYRFQSRTLSKQVKEWISFLRKNRYDIVHIQGMPNSGVIWLLTGKLFSHGTRFIVHAHIGERTTLGSGFFRKITYFFCYHLTNKIYQYMADVLAGCSRQAMDLHFGEKIAASGQLLNNGINLDKYRVNCSSGERGRNIITVARVAAEKNPHFTLKIIKALVAINKDWKLIWAGRGEMENEIREEIHKLKLEQHVSLLGHRTDIPELLQQHSYFILPSVFEALGISLIEAQAAGCICLASTNIPEVVDCGALIRLPLDIGPEAWADYINNLYNKETAFKIDNAKLAKYNVYETAAEVRHLYFTLCKKSSVTTC